MTRLSQNLAQIQRNLESAFLQRHSVKRIFRVPKNAQCNNCIQTVGCSICKSHCDYWKELQRLKNAGELKEVFEKKEAR